MTTFDFIVAEYNKAAIKYGDNINMDNNFIALFSLNNFNDQVINHFNIFLRDKKISDFRYQIAHGKYTSSENRNQGYTYLLKTKSTGTFNKFQSEVNEEYHQLLQKLYPWLGEKEPACFYYKEVYQKSNLVLGKVPRVNHTVILTFKDHCTDMQINEAFSKLSSLFEELKNINSFRYGYSYLSKKTYIFEMEFPELSVRDQYLAEPKHEQVANFIIPLLQEEASIIAFDYLLP